MQLAALALPTDPAPFAFVPHAPAMQQQEARAASARLVTLVELRDAGRRALQERRVTLRVLGRGIDPVGQQREMNGAFGAGEVMNLQPLDLLLDRGARGQQHRHRDQRAQACRHAVAQLQGGQEGRAQAAHHTPIHQRHGRVDGRNGTQNAEQAQPFPLWRRRSDRDERGGEQGGGDHRDGAHITADAEAAAGSPEPRAWRRPVTDRDLEPTASAGEEVIARIAPAVVGRVGVRGLRGGRDGAAGDVDLGTFRAARQLLDGAAIEIAGRKIHVAKVAAAGQHVVDQADALEQLRPVDVGDQAHAGDDVAHRYGAGALPVMLVANDRIGGRSLCGQALVEPSQRRRDARILVAQPVHELDGESVGQPDLLDFRRARRAPARRRVRRHRAGGRRIRRLPAGPRRCAR